MFTKANTSTLVSGVLPVQYTSKLAYFVLPSTEFYCGSYTCILNLTNAMDSHCVVKCFTSEVSSSFGICIISML